MGRLGEVRIILYDIDGKIIRKMMFDCLSASASWYNLRLPEDVVRIHYCFSTEILCEECKSVNKNE